MKEFKFEKAGLECMLTISNDLNRLGIDLKVSIGSNTPISCMLEEDKIVFSSIQEINGQKVAGFKMDNMAEIKAAYQAEIDERHEEERKLFKAYLTGEEKIYMCPERSTYIGNTANYITGFSISTENKCYHLAKKAIALLNIDDNNVLQDEDGNYYINQEIVKVQYKEYEEKLKESEGKKLKESEEKAEMLKGVESWETKETTEIDEDGETIGYIHTFKINKCTVRVYEKNIFDFGRVVMIDGRSENECNADELKCIEIVKRYGMCDNHIRM